MGLGDLISRVLVEVKGDTSDLRDEIKKLQGVEKDRAKTLLDDIERQNKGYDSVIGKLGSLSLALDAVGKFTDYARDAMKSYAEHSRLTAATAGINIDRLSDAFGGLVKQHDLLTFAAQTSNGVLALTQGQMETVGQAAIALRNRGFDLEESFKKLTDAAVKGKVGGLDDLGLSIKEGASRAETLRNMMTELNKVIAESGTKTKGAADDVAKLAVEWDNTTDAMKRYSVEALKAIDMQTVALQVYEQSLRESPMMKIANFQGFNGGAEWAQFNSAIYGGLDRGRDQERYRQGQASFAKGVNQGRQKILDSEVIEMPDLNVARSDSERAKMVDEAQRSVAAALLRSAVASTERNLDVAGKPIGFSLGSAASTTMYNEYGTEQTERGLLDSIEQTRTTNLTADWQKRLQEQQGNKTSFLESTFGTLDDFNAYAQGFQMLTGSVTSAMDAWITGSVSAGEAVKKFIGQALKALASQMAVEALKHGAYAIGSAAFGDFAGAGKHAAAAAAFGAGAAAAAVAAKSLGGSAGGTSGAGGGGGGGGRGGSNEVINASGTGTRVGGSNQMIVVYADPFAEGTPGTRRRNAQKVINRARGGHDWEDS